jgi:hypothetical protein
MLNSTILIKVKQRLNKLASNDYDNIQDWQIIEAFNKGQSDWVRRNLHGLNIVKEGDEQSKRRIDDLQILLTTLSIVMTNKQQYFESTTLPVDYLQFKRISTEAEKADGCCPAKKIIVYLAENQNTDILLKDHNKKPSYEWGETFATLKDNMFQVYTNNEFILKNTTLTYYRQPTKILITGVQDPYNPTAVPPLVDTISEFKDDIVELLIDECAKIIAGDIESVQQVGLQDKSVESNN